MAVLEHPAIYDELIEMLAESADAERVLAFQLSIEKQARLDYLLEMNRQGALTSTEAAELDGFVQFEHVVRMLKARVRRKRQS